MILTVVSYYAARTDRHLKALLGNLSDVAEQVLLVQNIDGRTETSLDEVSARFRVLSVPNRGMNIGAWNAAFRALPDYDHYVFLQDECALVDREYQDRYIAKLSTKGSGMTGESINPKWNAPWSHIIASPLNYKITDPIYGSIVDRVSFYLNCLNRWGIDPGPKATHLRALAWGFTNECLRMIDGFPVGGSKEECIAAEIAVSRNAVARGFGVSQVGVMPFECFSHAEWRHDGWSKVS